MASRGTDRRHLVCRGWARRGLVRRTLPSVERRVAALWSGWAGCGRAWSGMVHASGWRQPPGGIWRAWMPNDKPRVCQRCDQPAIDGERFCKPCKASVLLRIQQDYEDRISVRDLSRDGTEAVGRPATPPMVAGELDDLRAASAIDDFEDDDE